MRTCIALLRGINVGGKNSLPMKELVAMLEDIGACKIKTYLQSGNAIFQSKENDLSRLARKLSAEIKQHRGFEPYIASSPKKPDMEKLNSLKKQSEQFRLIGSVFYLYAPDGVGRSKLAASSEKLLGVPMTDRNWRTVCKILELARE